MEVAEMNTEHRCEHCRVHPCSNPSNLFFKLVLLVSVLAIFHVTGIPSPAASPTPFDMKATLDGYLAGLPDGFNEITPAALNEQIHASKPFLVDVREAEEIAAAGSIAGSIGIPLRSLTKNLDKLPSRDKPIVLICGSGHRSALGMEVLQLLGYINIKSLSGGIHAWRAAGLPVGTGTRAVAKTGAPPVVDMRLLAVVDRQLSNLADGWNIIVPTALKDLIGLSKPFQLELREPQELAESGFIPGVVGIPIRTLVRNLNKLPPDKGALIVAECSNGHRSALAMLALNLLGYSNVRCLAGGLAAWTKASLPVSK